MTTVDVLREFIVQELHGDADGESLTPEYPLIENQVIDSLGFLTLVSFVEERFGVQIADEELVPEHFATLALIASLIDRKVTAR